MAGICRHHADCTLRCAASALLHDSSAVAQRAVKFFLGQDDLEDDEEPDEGEGGLDVQPPSKQDVYKATAKARSRLQPQNPQSSGQQCAWLCSLLGTQAARQATAKVRLGSAALALEVSWGELQGTAASKKKKKKKLDRVMGTLKRKSRQGKAHQQHSFAALQLLHDPQVSPLACRLQAKYVAAHNDP